MSRKYKFHNPERLYFISFAVINWIDVFIRRNYVQILIDSLKFCQEKKGLQIHAWCIMTSHVHLIISSNGDPLPNIIRDFKSFTSTQLKRAIIENPQESRKVWMLKMMEIAGNANGNNNDFQFWQQHNKPIELITNKVIEQKLDYIHFNPVEAGIVDNGIDYLYSSARDYSGISGLIEIDIIQ